MFDSAMHRKPPRVKPKNDGRREHTRGNRRSCYQSFSVNIQEFSASIFHYSVHRCSCELLPKQISAEDDLTACAALERHLIKQRLTNTSTFSVVAPTPARGESANRIDFHPRRQKDFSPSGYLHDFHPFLSSTEFLSWHVLGGGFRLKRWLSGHGRDGSLQPLDTWSWICQERRLRS